MSINMSMLHTPERWQRYRRINEGKPKKKQADSIYNAYLNKFRIAGEKIYE